MKDDAMHVSASARVTPKIKRHVGLISCQKQAKVKHFKDWTDHYFILQVIGQTFKVHVWTTGTQVGCFG